MGDGISRQDFQSSKAFNLIRDREPVCDKQTEAQTHNKRKRALLHPGQGKVIRRGAIRWRQIFGSHFEPQEQLKRPSLKLSNKVFSKDILKSFYASRGLENG